jgi:hypothetical protein
VWTWCLVEGRSLIGFLFFAPGRSNRSKSQLVLAIDIAAAASIPATTTIDLALQLNPSHHFKSHSLTMGSGSSKPEGSQYVFAAYEMPFNAIIFS